MRRGSVVIAGLLAALVLPAQALERIETASPETAVVCPSVMTEPECRAHRQILATLSRRDERNAYLGMYEQLLGERRALCNAVPPEDATAMRQP